MYSIYWNIFWYVSLLALSLLSVISICIYIYIHMLPAPFAAHCPEVPEPSEKFAVGVQADLTSGDDSPAAGQHEPG